MRYSPQLFLYLMFFLLFSAFDVVLVADQASIRPAVTTEDGQAPNGFPIEIKFSGQATTTNEMGNFSVSARSNDTLFNFKYAFNDGKEGGIIDYDYLIGGSRFEGQPITQYNTPTDSVTNILIPIPWLAHSTQNPENSLRNGILSIYNLAISTKREVSDKRLLVSQISQQGTVPNTKLDSANFNFLRGLNAGKKVRFEAYINDNKKISPNYLDEGYGPNSHI